MKIVFSLFLITTNLMAQESYKISGDSVVMYRETEMQITASQACKKTKSGKECQNFAFLKKLSVAKLGRIPAGNPNTGALLCEDQLAGRSVIGLDENENQRSFCHLPQFNVYIDNGTLTYYGRKNDGELDAPDSFDPG